MSKGNTLSDIAVYLPTEDAWIKGRMPKEKQFIWAWGYYEMRYQYFPDELAGYNPTWINREFLEKAILKNGSLKVGEAEYKALYIDAEYLDYNLLKRLVYLAENNFRIILKRDPKEPGTLLHQDYLLLADELKKSKNASSVIPDNLTPFLAGNSIPHHWCRKDGETLYIFFPNPKSGRLKFPLEYGQSLEKETRRLEVIITYQGKNYNTELIFAPYQSLLYKIQQGKIEKMDITFSPGTPFVKERPSGYVAPWLVK